MEANKKIVANTLRILSAEMVEKANSGHPGMPLGFADAITALLYNINFDASAPNWINRDRIIFSCGHGSALWYSVLFGFGILTQNDLDNFRQLHSKTAGHPELGVGIDISTGPLGMGFSWAIGMALAERILNTKTDAINHHTFIICSDGDLMEGVSYEAAALAGQYKLNKIIAIWDNNEITIDGSTKMSRNENMQQRFLAANWDFIECDGHDITAVDHAIKLAKQNAKPTLISARTKIGKYSQLEDSSKAHGAPLGQENLEKLKSKIQHDKNQFLSEFENIKTLAKQSKIEWDQNYNYDDTAQEITELKSAKKIKYTTNLKLSQTQELKEKLQPNNSTRKHSLTILESLIAENENLVIASADLASSCYTAPKQGKYITSEDYSGNLLACGIRENGMVALMGGITLHGGLSAIASTFLTFYDYARPAIRLAALMKTPLIMIATHDSICVGEDGPTHQPIEHLDSLRCIPNLLVARPADGFETEYSYQAAIAHNGPSVLVFSRQNLTTIHTNFIDESKTELKAESDFVFNPEFCENGVIISSGSEMALALEVANQLRKCAISMPILKPLTKEFARDSTSNPTSNFNLNSTKPIHIIEASTGMLWNYYFNNAKIWNITTFGESGKCEDLLDHFKFTKADVIKWIES